MKQALKYDIDVTYNVKLPEAWALPESVKKRLEGYKSSDALIEKIQKLVNQLQC